MKSEPEQAESVRTNPTTSPYSTILHHTGFILLDISSLLLASMKHKRRRIVQVSDDEVRHHGKYIPCFLAIPVPLPAPSSPVSGGRRHPAAALKFWSGPRPAFRPLPWLRHPYSACRSVYPPIVADLVHHCRERRVARVTPPPATRRGRREGRSGTRFCRTEQHAFKPRTRSHECPSCARHLSPGQRPRARPCRAGEDTRFADQRLRLLPASAYPGRSRERREREAALSAPLYTDRERAALASTVA